MNDFHKSIEKLKESIVSNRIDLIVLGIGEVMKHYDSQIEFLKDSLELIANDDSNEYNLVCRYYSDLKNEARSSLEKHRDDYEL